MKKLNEKDENDNAENGWNNIDFWMILVPNLTLSVCLLSQFIDACSKVQFLIYTHTHTHTNTHTHTHTHNTHTHNTHTHTHTQCTWMKR